MKKQTRNLTPRFPVTRLAQFALVALCLLAIRPAAQAQSSYTWNSGGGDNNWSTGANWGGSGPGNPQAILNFGSGSSLSPYNDFTAGSAGHRIFFTSGSPAFTLGGNSITFYDYSGNGPKIENASSSPQTIGFPIVGGNAGGLEINPVSGDLALTGTLDNGGNVVNVYGPNSKMLTLSGAASGAGKLVVKEYSKVKYSATSGGWTGNTEIDTGEFWLGSGGSFANSSTIYVGNGGQVANTAKLWIEAGGGSLGNPIVINPGNSGTRVVGGLNNSGTVTYTGNLTLNGPLNLVANAAGGTNSFTSGVISGSGAVNVNNGVTATSAGTVNLAGANTYDGATSVDAGILRVSHATGLGSTVAGTTVNGTDGSVNFVGTVLDLNGVSVPSGETLTLATGGTTSYRCTLRTVGNTANTWAGNVVLSGSGLAQFTVSGGSGQLNISGGITASSYTGSSMTIRGSGAGTLSGVVNIGTTPLAVNDGATWTVSTTGNTWGNTTVLNGTLALGISSALPTATTLTLGGSTASGTLKLNGFNQSLAGLAVGSSGLAKVVNGNSTASTLTVNTTGTLTFGGVMGGAGANENNFALTKSGTGTLTLSGANTYAGKTIISAGTLSVNTLGNNGETSSALGSPTGANRTIDFSSSSTATLTYTGAATASDRPLNIVGNIKGTVNNSGTGLLTLTGGATASGSGSATELLFRGAGNITESGLIAIGSGKVQHADTGVVTLNNDNNSFTGVLGALGGTISVSSIAASGSPSAAGAGSQIDIGATSVTGTLIHTGSGSIHNRTLNLNGTTGGGIIDQSGASGLLKFTQNLSVTGVGAKTLTLQGSTLGSGEISGVIPDSSGGATAVTKTGSGTWALSGVNTFSGPFTLSPTSGVSGGVVVAAANNALGTGAATLLFNTGASNAQVQLSGGISLGNSIITTSGGGTDGTTTGILRSVSGNNVMAGRVDLIGGGGGSTYRADAGSTLTFNGNVGANASARVLTLSGGGNFVFSLLQNDNTGVTPANTLSLVNSGPSTTLSGANTYSVGTTLNSGKLILGHASALGTGTLTITGGSLDSSVANLVNSQNNAQSWNGDFTFVGTQNLNLGSGAVALNATRAVTVTANTLTVGGIISGSTFGLTKAGNGTLTLSGANTYTGTTTVNAGTLALSGSGTLGSGAALTVSGGTLEMGALSRTVGAVSVTGAGTIQNGSLTGTSYAASLASGTAIISANLLGSGIVLTKSGAGTLTLSGVNTYSGATTVSAGTLLVNSPGSLASGSAVSVSAGGTLGGSGTVSGTVNVAQNGLLAPGGVGTIGTLTLANSGATALTLSGGDWLQFDVSNVAGTSDKIAITGTLVLNFASTIALSFPNGKAPAGTYTLMTYSAKTGTGSLNLLGSYPNATLSVTGDATTPGSVTLTVTGAGTEGVTWNGNLSGVWDGGVQNWLFGSTAASYAAGDQVVFDDTAAGPNFTITSGGTVSPTSIVINNSTKAYTVSAVIGGAATILKYGSGTATLTAQNLNTGSTFVNGGGTLAVTGTGSLGSGGAAGLTLGQQPYLSGTLQYDSSATSSFTSMSIGASSAAGTLNQTAGRLNLSGSVTLAPSSSGAGTINLSGGTLAVTGNLFAGQRGSGAGTVNLSSAGILTVGGGLVLGDFSSGQPSTGVFNQSGGTVTAGSLVLAKSSTDANTHTGTYNLNGGTLNTASIAAGTATGGGTDSSTFNFAGGTLKPTTSTTTFMQGLTAANVKDGGALIDTAGFNITIAQPLLHYTSATTDSLTKNGAGTLTLSGANTYSGGTTLNAGAVSFTSTGLGTSGNITFGGNSTLQWGASTTTDLSSRLVVNNGVTATLDVGANNVAFANGIGASGSGALAKSGSGTLTLSAANTYSGATTVSAGIISLGTSGSISNTPSITVAANAVLDVTNLTGGVFTLQTNQTLKGNGTVSGNTIVSGTVAAGSSIGTLTNSGNLTWAPGGTNQVEVGTAIGTPGLDWDHLSITGDLVISPTNQPVDSQKFTIALVSIPGGVTNFGNGNSYAWPVATVGGTVYGFNAAKFLLNTNAFTNDLGGGAFSVLLSNQSVVVVFTPATVVDCAQTTTNWAATVGGNMVMTFSNFSGMVSVQALTLSNCTLTGVAYTNGGSGLTDVTGINQTNRTLLPANTIKLVLTATKITPGVNNAAVNALVIDKCGRGKSFDPVITTLTVTSGNQVQQRFEGLMSAEHYLHVVNGTPGLKWLEVNLNGRVFRLDPLTDGQSVSGDLWSAMREGNNNEVVLTGAGDIGASALVMITDTPTGNLLVLPEVVTLTLNQTTDGLVLSWPDTLTGWELQSSGSADAGWAALVATPVSVNGQFTVTVPATDGAQFYRLAGPAAAAASKASASQGAVMTGISASTPSNTSTIQRTYDGILW